MQFHRPVQPFGPPGRSSIDIQAIRGPPELLDAPDEPGGDDGDGIDDPQQLDWGA